MRLSGQHSRCPYLNCHLCHWFSKGNPRQHHWQLHIKNVRVGFVSVKLVLNKLGDTCLCSKKTDHFVALCYLTLVGIMKCSFFLQLNALFLFVISAFFPPVTNTHRKHYWVFFMWQNIIRKPQQNDVTQQIHATN